MNCQNGGRQAGIVVTEAMIDAAILVSCEHDNCHCSEEALAAIYIAMEEARRALSAASANEFQVHKPKDNDDDNREPIKRPTAK